MPAPTAMAGADRIDDTAAARWTDRRRSDMVVLPQIPVNATDTGIAGVPIVPECYSLSAPNGDHRPELLRALHSCDRQPLRVSSSDNSLARFPRRRFTTSRGAEAPRRAASPLSPR